MDVCRELGLRDLTEKSRFAVYQECFRRLCEAFDNGGPDAARTVFDADGLLNNAALAESAELTTLIPFIRSCDRATIRPKLERVLVGPPIPTDEDQNSSRGRNALFELNLASKLWTAGLCPQLSERPDMACEVESRLLLIECKRPASMGGARKAIRVARDQIVRDLKKCRAGSRGVVAVSLSKIINPGDKVFVYDDERSGRQGLARELDRLRSQFRETCRGLPDKIMGMIWHVITLGSDQSLPLMTVAQEMTVEGFIRHGQDDDRELRILFDRIHEFFS